MPPTTGAVVSLLLSTYARSFFLRLQKMATEVSQSAGHMTPQSSLLSSPMRRKNTFNGQNAIMELEQEVSRLKEILYKEERVKHVLQQAMKQSFGESPVSIPSFLPPKTKELLAELAMVNGEITLLEQKMSIFNQQISETKASNTYKIKRLNFTTNNNEGNLILSRSASALPMRPSDHESMFFINRAIKGDFLINKFTDEIRQSNTAKELQDRKNNVSRAAQLADNLVSISPNKPRAASKSRDEDNISHSRALSVTCFSDNSSASDDVLSQKWQPNKLSESILKCLTCIFMRLIRTTRAISEVEKAGVVSRSNQPNNSLSSRSFRTDAVLNQKTGPSTRRHSQTQDPHGIFDVEDSILRDIGPYKNYVIVTSNSLDPKSISSCFSLLKKLRSLISHLSLVDLKLLTHQQKLAFWVNIYNACLMQGYLHHGHPTTVEKMHYVMDKAVLNIGGKKLNAKAIEEFILRQPSLNLFEDRQCERDSDGDMIRNMYGLDCSESNVLFALSRGTRSSPAVRIYTSESIISDLERAKLEYIQASIVVTKSKKIMLPRLLVSSTNGIRRDMVFLVDWICNQLPTSCSLRKCMLESFKGLDKEKIKREINVEVMQYDCRFHYLLAM